MAEMLLINPRKRRGTKARKAGAKRRIVRRANPIAAYKPRKMRRRNPISAVKHVMRRRRRNPIGGTGMAGSYMKMIQEALMGGAGAVAMDVLYGYVNGMLPATLQTMPGTVGTGNAVKAVATVFLGKALNKATRGFSQKAAQASLTVQAHEIVRSFVPAGMALGYATPARVAMGTNRVGPIRRGVNAYTSGSTLLNAYTQAGSGSPILSGARNREGVTLYR